MPVNIIDTLKPKNGGNFPIVEAADIAVTSDKRLPEALAAKADTSALAETAAEVAQKADAADVFSETTNLQNQINQIEISATSEAVVAPEVAAARVGSDGSSYDTLKDRLDSELDASNSTIKNLYLNGVLAVPLNLERGNIDASGQYIDSTTRLRSPKLALSGHYTLHNPNGLSWYLLKYTGGTSAVVQWNVTLSEYELITESGYTYAFVFRNTDESVLNVDDCTAYLTDDNSEESYIDKAVTTLQTGIDTNTTEIDRISQDLYSSKVYGTWIQGTVASTDGKIDTSRQDRIADPTFYNASEIAEITFNEGFEILLGYYSTPSESGFTNTTTWISQPVSEFTGNYIRIAIKRTSGAAILPTDETGIIIHKIPIPVSKRFDNITEIAEEKFSTVPNAVYLCRDGMAVETVPPNSKYAIKSTAGNQYDMIRFSVTKSTDGQYVAVHDVYINGLAVNPDGTPIASQIRTDSLSVAEMNDYDWGLKYGSQYAGLEVPMLDDCLKFAAMYGLTVALDVKWELEQSDVDALTALLSKYGQLNAIFFAVSITNMQRIQAKSNKFSFLFAGTYEQMISQTVPLKELLSGYNHIYLAYRPMGDVPTPSVISFAMDNGFDIMYSPIEGIDELMSVNIGYGITLYECHYIPQIKTTVKAAVDALIEE